jgi:hypothetical protein
VREAAAMQAAQGMKAEPEAFTDRDSQVVTLLEIKPAFFYFPYDRIQCHN